MLVVHNPLILPDAFPMGQAFWSSCLREFKQLLKCLFPYLTEAQVLAAAVVLAIFVLITLIAVIKFRPLKAMRV